MISRVHRRGSRVGGLLRYLYGPGRKEEHVNPRLVAAWSGAGELAGLEPVHTARGTRDFRPLVALLEEPVRAARRAPDKPVWHCSMRLAPEDRNREFSDATWGHMAAEMLAEVGVATAVDDPGLRWVVVRHGDDHVHIVATLVREDGRTNWMRNDYPRCVSATYNVARRYGLNRRVPPADRTAHRRPHPVEVGKSRRHGRRETPRDVLRRRVRVAAAGAGNEQEFFARLHEAGVMVQLRESGTTPGQITGYSVALPGSTSADGAPIYFSGGRLAPELTLPKLRLRWGTAPAAPARERVRPSRAERITVLNQAADTARTAAAQMRAAAPSDPAVAQAIAQAAADTLHAAAYAVEGRAGGPLTRAAEVFDRAARDLYGRVARTGPRSYEMRAMARLVALMGRVSGDEDTWAVLKLVLELARLGDTLAWLREAQQRLHQAQAARTAAALLRAQAAEGGTRPAASTLTPTPPAGSRTVGGPRPGRGR